MFEGATDASGNVYLTDFFNNTASFGSTTLIAVSNGDIFITRWH